VSPTGSKSREGCHRGQSNEDRSFPSPSMTQNRHRGQGALRAGRDASGGMLARARATAFLGDGLRLWRCHREVVTWSGWCRHGQCHPTPKKQADRRGPVRVPSPAGAGKRGNCLWIDRGNCRKLEERRVDLAKTTFVLFSEADGPDTTAPPQAGSHSAKPGWAASLSVGGRGGGPGVAAGGHVQPGGGRPLAGEPTDRPGVRVCGGLGGLAVLDSGSIQGCAGHGAVACRCSRIVGWPEPRRGAGDKWDEWGWLCRFRDCRSGTVAVGVRSSLGSVRAGGELFPVASRTCEAERQ